MSYQARYNAFICILAKDRTSAKASLYAKQYRQLYVARRLTEFAICVLLVFGGQQFLVLNGFFSPIWPAAGVALTALFLRGRPVVLAIFAGTLISYYINNIPLSVSVFHGIVFSAYLNCIRKLCYTFAGGTIPLSNVRTLLTFIGIVTFLTGAHAFFVTWLENPNGGVFDWYVAFLGEVNGILCLTPLCLMFDPFVISNLRQRSLSWAGFALPLVLTPFLYFFIPEGPIVWGIAIALALGFAFYAHCFGQIPTCLALLGVSLVYFAGTLSQQQLFQAQYAQTTVAILFTSLTITAILSLAIATQQRQRYFQGILAKFS